MAKVIELLILAVLSMIFFHACGFDCKKLENGLLLGYILAQKVPRFLPM